MKRKRLVRMLGVVLSCTMLCGAVPRIPVSAAEQSRYLTDAEGNQRAQVGKMTAQNHEIIDINITDGKTHKISVYLLDEDNSGRWSIVDMINPDTQKLMDSQNVYDFSDGVYLSYNVSGHVQLRLTNVWTKRYQNSKDTAIHGIFIDGEDAVEKGAAKVETGETEEEKAADELDCINVLGRFANAGEDFSEPFDKEVQSVEMRFDGSIDPSNENIDQIQVLKDGVPVEGKMRTGLYSVTFQPATTSTMRDGSYEVVIPGTVKNTEGKEFGKEYRTKFEVKTDVFVTFFRDGLNYQSRRVDVSFNDRIASSTQAALVYNGEDGSREVTLANDGYGIGSNGGRLFAVMSTILPSGSYTFTLPAGVESISGAVSEEDYVHEFDFDSTQLSAKIQAPYAVQTGETFEMEIPECCGYGEVRYAFSEEDLQKAEYQPVAEKIEIDPGSLTGDQTLYVQFRVKAGSKEGTESPLLYKAFKIGELQEGRMLTFDMQSAGAYDKDGFGSVANPTDGVFDLATDEWCVDYMGPKGTSNYIADGQYGLSGLYDNDKDGKIVTKAGIEYQLSTGLYTDGAKNVATGNGVEVPAPAETEYEKIYVLAAGKSDSEKGTFVMNYTDGTSSEQEIETHYWGGENAPTDNIVFNQINMCAGWSNNAIWQGAVMRQYELYPESGKTLKSITLPETTNLIRVFAMTGKESDIVGGEAVAAYDGDVLSYQTSDTALTPEEQDMTYDEFVELYGDDPVLKGAADVTDVTNIKEVLPGERDYDEDILKEQETPTGEYGQSLYPYARQPEKLMSYKIRMQAYENYELDFEDALEAIRRVDNLTRGLDKKCYLVGWQTNGHDTGYPYIGEVNPRHKRPMDETSLDSLKWLIKEAKEKYNTTITLHVNFSDAYTDDDPISQQMLEDQLAIREADGSIRATGYWAGHKGYSVSAYGNYFTGNWQKNQVDPLLEMVPELEGQSIHPDAWYSWNDPYYGLGSDKTTDAQRRSAMYMRENYGMDLTTEFDVAFGAGEEFQEDHVLYFPMIWQHGWSKTNPLMVPSYIQSGVNETTWDGQYISAAGRYFGEGTAVEPNLWGDAYASVTMPGLKQSFVEKELTRQYLNTLLRHSLEDDEAVGGEAVLYSGDGQKVVSAWNGDNTSASYKRTVTVGDDVVLQEPGNVFMPMTWRANREIQAWSKDGYQDKTWKLPAEWEDVAQVDIYDLNLEGLRYIETKDVTDRTFTMDMAADQSVVIVPAGQDPNSTKGFEQNGTVQFLGRDTETGGNWTKTYGGEGYDIYDQSGENMLPNSVEISYVNGNIETISTGTVKTEIEELYNEVKDLEKGSYTDESWKAFEEARDHAKAVLDNEDATQEEVDAAAAELQSAIDGLRVSKTTLEYFLNSAKEHLANGDADDAVESVRKLLEEAIAEGESVMAKEDATKEEVMNATVKLMKAIQALDMKAGDKTDLEMAVELGDMIDLSKYVEAGQKEFTDALSAAKDVLADGDAMQEDIDSAWSALVDALDNLRLKANKDALEDLLGEVSGLDLSKYTEESVAVLEKALARANEVMADETLSVDDQDTVDEAVKALQSAKDGLVAKTDDNGNGGQNGGSNDGSTSGSGQGGSSQNGGAASGSADKNPAGGSKAAKTGDTTAAGVLLAVVMLSSGAVIILKKKRA